MRRLGEGGQDRPQQDGEEVGEEVREGGWGKEVRGGEEVREGG